MYKFDLSTKGLSLDLTEWKGVNNTIQIVENTNQGKFCSPLIVSSFSSTQGMFIREINTKKNKKKNIWSDSFLLAYPYAY